MSVTLIAGTHGGTVDEYAQSYLAGNTVRATRDEERQGAKGKGWVFTSADGGMHYRLLLVKEESRVYGLYSQGEAEQFPAQEPVVEEMEKSLTLERWAQYHDETNGDLRFSLRVPPSWRDTRTFSGGGSYFKQFTSPAMGADRNGQTAHAFLSITVEPLAPGATAEQFYASAHDRMGESFQVLSHTPWKDGFADVLHSETPVAVSRGKRFYRVAGGKGYTLSFEARDDVYPRVSRWCDMIAATLKVGDELPAQ